MKRNTQIIGLDALRFAAALLVVAFHLCFLHGSNLPGAPLIPAYQALEPFTHFGWVGVEIFFVLSGFVIAYSAQSVTAGQFLQHRIVRLFPGVLICATLTATVMLFSANSSPAKLLHAWIRSVVFFPRGPWIDNSYWTLSIEVAFYAVIFLLLYLKKMNALQTVMGCIGLLSTAFWIVAFLPGNRLGKFLLESVIANETGNILLLRHGCYFAIGVLLWIGLFKGFTPMRLAILLLCTGGGILQIIFRSHAFAGYSQLASSSTLAVFVWLLAVGAIVLSVRHNERTTRTIGSRGVTLMRRLGLMTYPLYLLHAEIGLRLTTLLRSHLSDRTALAAAIAIVITMAYLVSTYLEPPLQQKIRQIFPTRLSPDRLVAS